MKEKRTGEGENMNEEVVRGKREEKKRSGNEQQKGRGG